MGKNKIEDDFKNLKNEQFRNVMPFNGQEPSLNDLLNKCQDLYEDKKRNSKSNFRISRNDNKKTPLFMKVAAGLIIGGVITAGIVGMSHKTDTKDNITISQETKSDFSSFSKIKEVIESEFKNITSSLDEEVKKDSVEDKTNKEVVKKAVKEISQKKLTEQHKLGSHIGLSEQQKVQNSMEKAVSKYLEVTHDSLEDDNTFVNSVVKAHFDYLEGLNDVTSLSTKINLDSETPLNIQSQKMKDSKSYFHGLYSDGKLFAIVDKDGLKYSQYADSLETKNEKKKVSTWVNPDESPIANARKL